MFIDFSERGREKERGEKYWSAATHIHPDQGLSPNLSTCPDQESKLQPFGEQMTLQPTEPPIQVKSINFEDTWLYKHFLNIVTF